jgi:phage terminase large subunit
MSNRDIFNSIKGIQGHIVADSAEPKSIAELQQYGLSITGAVKGRDSIIHGIQLLQSNEIYITSQSINLIKELRNYVWDKDRYGQTIPNKPIDAFNHCIDAARYGAEQFIGNHSTGEYHFG